MLKMNVPIKFEEWTGYLKTEKTRRFDVQRACRNNACDAVLTICVE